eukprot:15449130-Alexandrium_andersonii.AAC.1
MPLRAPARSPARPNPQHATLHGSTRAHRSPQRAAMAAQPPGPQPTGRLGPRRAHGPHNGAQYGP